jgi:hypothetical protein
MPIKFTCPHCKTGLSVKDHLGGKRARCRACKKPLTIPKGGSSTTHAALTSMPARPAKAVNPPPPNLDAEAEAAEALADEPAASKETRTVDFNCPFCDEELKLDIELAGKKTSCPECRRIITVPAVEAEGPQDWRKAAKAGPSGAKGQDVPEPEGAWGSAKAQHVSRDALLEADVLPDRKVIPLTTRQKIIRWTVTGVGILCLPAALYFVYLLAFGSSEQRALNNVIAFADADAGKEKVGQEGIAVLDLGIAQYYVKSNKPNSAVEAKKRFEMAVKQLTTGRVGPGGPDDRDGVLIDLAAAAADLVGTKEEAKAGLRLDEKESQKLLRSILDAIQRSAARLEALRQVTRRLVAAHQSQRAQTLATQVFSGPAEQSEAIATVGLELSAAGENDLAAKAVDQALTSLNATDPNAPTGAPPATIALATLLKRPVPKGKEDMDEKLAKVELLARQGNVADALKAEPPQGADKAQWSWLQLHLVQLGADSNVDERVLRQTVDAIPEPALRARGRLLILRGRFAHNSQAVGDDVLEGIDAKTASQYQARMELARHNARAGGSSAQGWDEKYRPFGIIGALLKE